MTRRLPAVIAALLILVSCGGGSSTPTTSTVVARFTPDTPNPGPATIAILQDSTNGAAVTVRVTVTGVTNFFGAAFRITYDPNTLLFGAWDTSSSFLSEGLTPQDTPPLFSEDHTSIGGTVVVVATRLNPELPVDVGATSTLCKIVFVARKPIALGATDGRLDFADPKQVCDGTVAAPGCNPITVTWSGGGLSAQ